MAAPPERRPQRVLAQLIERLETTKPSAGLVDPATDFAVCRQFALSVYARADKHDVRSAQTATPTQTQVEAFSAAGTFLKTLDQSQFAGMYDEDLKRRQEYAEWRAWDLATAMHAGRQPSPVAGHAEGPPVHLPAPCSPRRRRRRRSKRARRRIRRWSRSTYPRPTVDDSDASRVERF